MSEANPTETNLIISSGFKKRTGTSTIRKRTRQEDTNDSDDDSNLASKTVAETLELQKLRKKPHGVSVEALVASRGEATERPPALDDLASIQAGGMMSARTAKAMAALPSLHSGGQHIDVGTEFSAETQRRDEDYDMLKFIEEEVARRKTSKIPETEEIPILSRPVVRPEDALLVVAENFKRSGSKRSEEMLSHQMLSGIPEIDLGIEAKIKNIEATEEAKRRLMQKYRDRSPGRSSKTSSEKSMDYVQHKRYNMDSYKPQVEAVPDQVPSQSSSKHTVPKITAEKPSDDAYFERYKKNFQEKVEKDKKKRKDK